MHVFPFRLFSADGGGTRLLARRGGASRASRRPHRVGLGSKERGADLQCVRVQELAREQTRRVRCEAAKVLGVLPSPVKQRVPDEQTRSS